MRKFGKFVLPLLLVGVTAIACDDDDDNGVTAPNVEDIAGSWVMTQGTFDPASDQIPTVNLLGVTSTPPDLVIQDNGDFDLTIQLLGQTTPTEVTGTIDITGANTATITTTMDPNNPAQATFTLSDNTLTLNVPDAQLIDLTGDDQVTDADIGELDVTFERQQ